VKGVWEGGLRASLEEGKFGMVEGATARRRVGAVLPLPLGNDAEGKVKVNGVEGLESPSDCRCPDSSSAARSFPSGERGSETSFLPESSISIFHPAWGYAG